MSRTPSDRGRDTLTRVAAGVVVPVVAVAAHGFGAGALPSTGGMLLTAAIGVLTTLAMGDCRRRSTLKATLSAVVALTAAQLAAHVAMSIGHPAMHIDQHALLPMTVTHAVAIPVSALLIVVAAGLLAALTSTIRAITVEPVIASHTVAAISREMPRSGGALVIGGCGVRAPPGSS